MNYSTRDLEISRDFALEGAREEKNDFLTATAITLGAVGMSMAGLKMILSEENTITGAIMFAVSGASALGACRLAIDNYCDYKELANEAEFRQRQIYHHLSEK